MSVDWDRKPGVDVTEERSRFLEHLDALIDVPLTLLGLVWLGLVVADLVTGLSPEMQAVVLALWILFVADYLLELFIAPDRAAFVRSHWLEAVALLVPAMRVLRAVRILQSLRVLRTLSLARILTSTNRAMGSFRFFLGQNHLGFVIASSGAVALSSAAGVYYFEHSDDGQIDSFGDALWWSAMMMTTMGSQFWPETTEGRLIAWLLAVYAFVVFGYVTATLAAHFLRSDERDRGSG